MIIRSDFGKKVVEILLVTRYARLYAHKLGRVASGKYDKVVELFCRFTCRRHGGMKLRRGWNNIPNAHLSNLKCLILVLIDSIPNSLLISFLNSSRRGVKFLVSMPSLSNLICSFVPKN